MSGFNANYPSALLRRTFSVFVLAVLVCAVPAGAFAQRRSCPYIQPTALERGVDALNSGRFAEAADYFETHLVCLDQSRPGVRDQLNAAAAARLAYTYERSSRPKETIRVVDETLAWLDDLVRKTPVGPVRFTLQEQMLRLIGTRAVALLQDDRFAEAEQYAADMLIGHSAALQDFPEHEIELRRVFTATALVRGQVVEGRERGEKLLALIRRVEGENSSGYRSTIAYMKDMFALAGATADVQRMDALIQGLNRRYGSPP